LTVLAGDTRVFWYSQARLCLLGSIGQMMDDRPGSVDRRMIRSFQIGSRTMLLVFSSWMGQLYAACATQTSMLFLISAAIIPVSLNVSGTKLPLQIVDGRLGTLFKIKG
jgi:hypothetical protein